jgi:hypothetical protein
MISRTPGILNALTVAMDYILVIGHLQMQNNEKCPVV